MDLSENSVNQNADAAVEWRPSDAFAAVSAGESADLASVYGETIARHPVARTELGSGACVWAALGWDELRSVLVDHRRFTSSYPHFGTRKLPPIEVDPPEHSGYRRMLNPYFSAAALERMEADIRRFVTEAIVAMIAEGTVDALPHLQTIPMRTLCRLLGVPDAEWRAFARLEAELEQGRTEVDFHDPAGNASRAQHAHEGIALARELIRARREAPLDDVISGIATKEINGRILSDDEAEGLVTLLVLAGYGTTNKALAAATRLVATMPGVQDELRSDPQLIPAAVEEILRMDASVPSLDRRATEDVEIGDACIKRGDVVMTAYGAANYDPKVFEDPGTFRLDRQPYRHQSFGSGVHKCAGAPLARTELRIYLEELLARTSNVSLTAPVKRKPWPNLSYLSLDVSLQP